jgi:hypothetical protein
MEADWEVEIGGPAPIIDAHWTGFIDLSQAPDRARQMPEAALLPSLPDVLLHLNASTSPVWTSKCDVWHPDAFDPDELDAFPGSGDAAIACYIDLLPRGQRWPEPAQAVSVCKAVCARLHEVCLRCCRADLIVRRAVIVPGRADLGVTAYFTACASTSSDAAARLGSALAAFVECV